jgi:hypothetical protein
MTRHAMLNHVASSEDNDTLTEDARWSLVERIVASPSFAKSDRLRQFLTFICQLSLQGRDQEINEVNIGAQLFGRPNYDPSVDGIVRSHASRMRQRLDQYFTREGSDEPIRLIIPKGTYVPVFEPRPVPLETPQSPALDVFVADAAEIATQQYQTPPRTVPWMPRILGTAVLLACAAIIYLLLLLHSSGMATRNLLDAHPLWASFFASGRQSLVVCSDTSLAVLQDMTSHEVNLSDYVNGNYRMTIASSQEATADVLRDLAVRRYTAIADVGILTRFYQLPGIYADRIQFRYARDVLPDDLKEHSVVLIGSKYSDPWVALFEPHMNFLFRADPRQHISSVINRSPRLGEMPQYNYGQEDGSHSVYGVVALRPNLRASGKVLILEGTSMAGTEAAADFVFDDHLLLPFLAKITARDGRVPYFEVLLQSINMNGSASQIKILGYRTSMD